MRGVPPIKCGSARTRGVAPEVSAQRACERSNERGRGAAGSPDTKNLLRRRLFRNGSARFARNGSARFARNGSARFARNGSARFARNGSARFARNGSARFAGSGPQQGGRDEVLLAC